MAEFTLPANSKIGKGKTVKAPAGANADKKNSRCTGGTPDDGKNPRGRHL